MFPQTASCAAPFGELSPSLSREKPALNEEVYNDFGFYQQLLKDFVTITGVDLARKHGGDDLLRASKKLKRNKKTAVDVRASKGRKLKYIVHEKLLSFQPSSPEIDSRLEDQRIDLLFASLFQA